MRVPIVVVHSDTMMCNISSESIKSMKTTAKLYQTALRIPKTEGFAQKKCLDEELLNLLTNDFHQFSIVDDIGFREFCHSLNPYMLPSGKTLSNTLLPAKFEEVSLKT